MNGVKLLQKRFSQVNQIRRHFSVSTPASKGFLDNVTVIGAGHMGTGIAQNAGVAGNNVVIADINQSSLNLSKQKIENRLLKVSKKKLADKSDQEIQSMVNSVLQRFKWTTSIADAVVQADLVIESVPERLSLKHKLFGEIDKIAPPDTVFTTNTSSLRVQEIAQPVSPERKKRFGGTHFFDRDVKLVEIIKTDETSAETYHKLMEWAGFIGKVPIVCKDTPGFIVNRLNIPYFLNAMRMYERGDAGLKDIDTAMKLGAGYPFGPFELADHIGLDVMHDIFQGLEKRFENDPSFKCPESLTRLFNEGKFGRKSGQGFFKYSL